MITYQRFQPSLEIIMNIGFIEDTHFHGGTQIWVTEAIEAFLTQGQDVTLLAPESSWIVKQCADSGAHIYTYDWNEVVHEREEHIQQWTAALRQCDVAVCTVHPPNTTHACGRRQPDVSRCSTHHTKRGAALRRYHPDQRLARAGQRLYDRRPAGRKTPRAGIARSRYIRTHRGDAHPYATDGRDAGWDLGRGRRCHRPPDRCMDRRRLC